MEKPRSSSRNLQLAKRHANSLHAETAFDISQFSDHGQLPNKEVTKYDLANTKYARVSSARRGRADPELHIDVLPSSKAGWCTTPYFQPQTAKQVCENEVISAIQSFSSTEFPSRPGLDGKDRLEPSLFPFTNSTTASQVFTARIQPSATTNDLLALRPIVSSQNICINHQLDSRASEIAGYQVCSLSGRFLIGEPVTTRAARQYCIHHQPAARSWLDHKLCQVCSGSDTMPRVSRYNMGHKTQRKVPVGTKVPNATQSTSATDEDRQLVPQTVPIANGETQLCHVRDPTRAAPLSNTAILQSTTAEAPPIPQSTYSVTSSNRNAVVAQHVGELNAYTHGTDHTPVDNRRIRLRMGRTNRRQKHNRHLAKQTKVLARKQKGNVCSDSSDSPRETSSSGRSDTSPDRQPHRRRLYKQRRWDQIKKTSRTDSRAAFGSRPLEYFSDSTVLPRQIQRRSGRAVTRKVLPGVASYTGSNEQDISYVGHAGSGSIRVRDCTCSSAVCICRPARFPSSVVQRVSSPVELRTSMAFSSTQSCSTRVVPPQRSPRPLHTNSPELEESILANGSSAASAPTSISNSRAGPSAGRHEDGLPSARDTGPVPGGMVDFGWQGLVDDWTETERKLLMSSWRKSTINTYKPAWNRWKRWCHSQAIPFQTPKAEQVARYLAHLHNDEGLAYKTILVHKSVIATFTNVKSGEDLSSNFFVKHILKAISVAKPRPAKPPIWNPKILLQYLTSHPPSEDSLYQVSRHTATLLLLASGRRVHDLTLLNIDPGLIDEGDAIVFWPTFGSKTDNATYRQSGWRLREHPDKNLNVLYWIRQLLSLSQSRRADGQFKELFVTARGDPKPASRTVIGGWIKSLLKEAGIETSPGTLRSAVASLNWLESFPIDQILSTGNWKREHTFRSFYHRELLENNTTSVSRNDSVSLSNFFDAVR